MCQNLHESFSKIYSGLKDVEAVKPAIDTSNQSVPVSSAADVQELMKVDEAPILTFDTIQGFLDVWILQLYRHFSLGQNVETDPHLKSVIDPDTFSYVMNFCNIIR